MSAGEDDQSENIFLRLMSRVVRKPLYRFPEQWRSETYEPRIYKSLGTILSNATAEEFDSFILDFITFTKTAHVRLDMRLYIEFINVYANFILYWVFVRRKHADIVRKQMKLKQVYGPKKLNEGGVTPLMLIARNLQCDILKGLFQYGMPECERRPLYVVISILFHPSSLEETVNVHNHDGIISHMQECMVLCFRVLKYISITDRVRSIKTWMSEFGVEELDWLCIPTNRCQEPCELTHLCRVSVRARLLLTGGLPDAIKILPLPTYLQHYLNLKY
uniref:SOCS box domain-containing protein n=1 Tax=Electrophorus electricus TaxID=8005 RepID=A0A4W4ETP9_ELEEL